MSKTELEIATEALEKELADLQQDADTENDDGDAQPEAKDTDNEQEDDGADDGEEGDSKTNKSDKTDKGNAADEKRANESGEKESLTPEEHAKRRIEQRNEKKRLKELEEKNAQLQNELASLKNNAQPKPSPQAKPDEPIGPEPNKEESYEAWLEWNIRTLQNEVKETKRAAEVENVTRAAFKAFQDYEAEVIPENPDYLEAVRYGRQIYTAALRLQHPKATPDQLNALVNQQILLFAADADAEGVNPAAALYDYIVAEMGYKPTAKGDTQSEAPDAGAKPKKPDLDTIAKNKKRSASPLAGGGSSDSTITLERATKEMTWADLGKLTPEQLRQLEQGD